MVITQQAIDNERARRFALLDELMAENKLDAILFSCIAMEAEQLQIKYLAQYTLSTRRAFGFKAYKKSPKLILPTIGQKYTAAFQSWIEPDDILSSDSIAQTSADLIDELPGTPRVGVVSFDMLPVRFHSILTQSKAEFVEIEQEYVTKYAPKSELEIEFIKDATELAVGSFEDVVRRIEPGINEWELMAGAEHYCFARGAKQTLLLSRSEKPHTFIGKPYDKPVKPDSIFVYSVELAGKYGYWSQVVRPIFMSRQAHPDAFEVWKIAKEAEKAGAKAFRPGNLLCDVAIAVEEVIDKYGCTMGVWCGHGMGSDLGDGIDLGRPNKMPIVPNMVLTIHPSIQGKTDGLLYGNTYLSTTGDAISLSGKYEESPYLDYFRSVI